MSTRLHANVKTAFIRQGLVHISIGVPWDQYICIDAYECAAGTDVRFKTIKNEDGHFIDVTPFSIPLDEQNLKPRRRRHLNV